VYHSAGISDDVNFKLSPYITANKDGTYSCVDEENCDEETYFLCAESVGATTVDFLVCQDASNATAAAGAEACASSNKPSLDWNQIATCFGGPQAASLKKDAAAYFHNHFLFPKLIGVPRIEINGKNFKGTQPSWQKEGPDLIKALCATGIKADACSNSTEILSYL